MREYAHILYDFNGGESCVRLYIAKLNFFFDEVILRKDMDTAEEISARFTFSYCFWYSY
jgi:hypothetical protein